MAPILSDFNEYDAFNRKSYRMQNENSVEYHAELFETKMR